jgi:hypothetical protein
MAYTGLSTITGDIADDVSHGHEVLVIEALLDGDVLDLHQFAQRHERRAAGTGFGQRVGIAGTHAEGEKLLRRGFGASGQFEANIDVFLLLGLMQQIDRFAIDGDFERLRDRGGADAVQRGFFLVDDEAGFLLIGLDVPIHIDDAGVALEDGLHGFGELQTRLFIRP